MEKVEVKTDGDKNELNIWVKHPKKNNSKGFLSALFGKSKPNVSVQFYLKVPQECDLTVSSVNGSVDVTGVSGAAELKTVNGKILAKDIQGVVDASTTNGSVNVEITKADVSENMKFKTVNGSVKVILPEDISADVAVSTVNGKIHTDFPVEIQGKFGPKKIRGEINGGGFELNISTVNGSVTLNSI
jgi:DUF4097 and DUF4098 domain-containing protein YvlB